MSEHQQRVQREQQRRTEVQPEPLARVERARDDAAFDALLDEIDGVLETNAEEYVRSFVQKGGQ